MAPTLLAAFLLAGCATPDPLLDTFGWSPDACPAASEVADLLTVGSVGDPQTGPVVPPDPDLPACSYQLSDPGGVLQLDLRTRGVPASTGEAVADVVASSDFTVGQDVAQVVSDSTFVVRRRDQGQVRVSVNRLVDGTLCAAIRSGRPSNERAFEGTVMDVADWACGPDGR